MAGKGSCNPAPRVKEFLPLSVHFFWDFGHLPAGMALVAGQSRVGLLQYSTASLPNAAGAMEGAGCAEFQV